jgi:hypothetical protein
MSDRPTPLGGKCPGRFDQPRLLLAFPDQPVDLELLKLPTPNQGSSLRPQKTMAPRLVLKVPRCQPTESTIIAAVLGWGSSF